MNRWTLLGVLALFLVGCGGGLEGRYTDEMGMSSYTFNSNGTVSIGAMGMESEVPYRVEDGKVKIGTREGSMVLGIIDDETLEGPLGLKLKKKKN